MKNFLNQIKEQSHKMVNKSIAEDFKKYNTTEKRLKALKSFKLGLILSSTSSAIIFWVVFFSIGIFTHFLIENNYFSFLHQIMVLLISAIFIYFSGVIFLSSSYSIEKVSEFISNLNYK